MGYTPPPTSTGPLTGAELLADLTAQLDALKSQLAQGTTPSQAQLKTLDDTFAALSAALSVMSPQAPATPADPQTAKLLASLGVTAANPSPAIADARGHLAALSQSFAATAPALADQLDALATQLADLEASPDRLAQFIGDAPDDGLSAVTALLRALLGDAPAQAGETDPAGQLQQILAALGIGTAPPAAPTAPADVAAVSPALLRLSNQLSAVATELSTTAPELSARLEAMATRLVSADTDPKLFAALTAAAADPDGAALDQLVRGLLDPRPAPAPALLAVTPQVAATTLDIPAPLLPSPTKSAVAEVKAAQPQTAPVTADSATASDAPRLHLTRTADDVAEQQPAPQKADASATTIVADAVKSDPAQTAAQQLPTAPAPVAAAVNARALPAAYQAAANPINMGQVAFEMVRQVHQGTSRFTIRLDPPELGRIDVKMHVDNQGAVTARLTVDRAETLDMFQRDQRQLERALAQAGLDSARTTLEFSLRQNPSGGSFNDQRQQQSAGGSRFSPTGNDEPATSVPAITLYRGTASAGGVNIIA